MENEKDKTKTENQQKLIAELTSENELLYNQYSHLMIRNNKLLKRIDDQQQIIGDLHIRIEELQLINDNLLKLNDGLINRNAGAAPSAKTPASGDGMRSVIDNLNRRMDELNLRSDVLHKRTSLLAQYSNGQQNISDEDLTPKSNVNHALLFDKWKTYPKQEAKNAPNLRKQMQMLVHLFETGALNSSELFSKTGVNGVTGARYVSVLKSYGLIEYTGARKKGKYVITAKGKVLVEEAVEKSEVETGN